MDYRRLGQSGLQVSPLCLGTMMFGGPTGEADAARIVDRARDQGVNFIDTADGYNGGGSEEVVGPGDRRRDRRWWVLATKMRQPDRRRGRTRGGCRAATCSHAVEASLRRLGTDVIDVLYLHKEDHATRR